MKNRDWHVNGDGQYQACKSARAWNLLRDNYRLYRFLTELEDILNDVEDETSRLPEIQILVRRLLVNSYWVQSQYLEPCPKTGTSVLILYDELGFPLTLQTVTFAPGTKSNIHNHGTWGVVALLKGQEKNTFWRRDPSQEFIDKIEQTGELTLLPGDIISFTPDTIHCVEALGNEPTVTFNIYGETDPKQRFEYNVISHTAKNF
ncbi:MULTISPECIES: cupin [Fischerella]|uniref:Cupin n=1 Tax=Fischerella muscicola CCMEE 5323 TaxID=2019572 RepID=A0A2N6JVS3_FISMU|nr:MULTISPECIES: cupin [Fischerella]MBD2431620.1 cupin [Fischerella sp. FACHB-380]PLZ83733.1 cupin [Fischerella muscicola CCMEE 5323]